MTDLEQRGGRRLGDAIEISGDYQARALRSDRVAQRFWHEAKFRLIERLGLPEKSERVLDAGCGSGTISEFLSRYANQVVGIDSNPAAISYASKAYSASNLEFKLGQFEDLRNQPPFDRIYCIEVIEHLYEKQVVEIFTLFRQLTNPGATLFLTTPNYRSLWPVIERLLDAFGLVPQLDEVQHVTHFTKPKLAAVSDQAGWAIEQIGSFNGLAPFVAPMSYRLALAIERVEFRLSQVLPENLLFCVCKKADR